MLMPIGSVEQRARRANFDAVAALRTIQPAAERADDRVRPAIAGLNCFAIAFNVWLIRVLIKVSMK